MVVVSVANVGYGGIFSDQFLPVEAHVKASGLPYTLLRLPLFIDNHWASKGSISAQGTLYGPARPDARFAPIAVADIGEAAAVVLASPGKHAGKTYTLNTAEHSYADAAAAIGAGAGKAVAYVQVPYEGALAAFVQVGFPEWQAKGVIELLHQLDDGAAYYRSTGDFEAIVGHGPTTIQQWAQQVGPAFK